METFEDIDKDIFMMLMNEELMNIKNLIREEKIQSEKLQNVAFQCIQEKVIKEKDEISVYKKVIKMDKIYLNDQIEKVKENDQNVEYSNENHSGKVIIRENKELKEYNTNYLKKLLHSFINLTKLKYINKKFKLTSNKNFEQQKLTQINLQQKEDESFKLYFERIQTNLSKRTNELEINQTQTNISDFLYTLKVHCQEQLVKPKYFAKIQIEQEFLIQQIRKLYLQNNQEEQDEKSNQKLGLFTLRIKSIKILRVMRNGKLNRISSNCLTDTIFLFCQKDLIQLWVQEKDQRIRNILKDQHLISVQMKILQKDWQTQYNRIQGEVQKMLRRIDELQEQISNEPNINKRDLQLKEMDETTQQLDGYIENIMQMGQQFRLITNFVNHIRKGLVRVEGKINEMKEQLNSKNNDIKFLRGKSVEQLLEIRKWIVLKEQAYNNIKSIYVPLNTQEKGKNDLKVNEFLQEKKTVLLIYGIAGSGKSTTVKKIEEFILKLHGCAHTCLYFITFFKKSGFQAVEEALHQDDYSFNELQLKECKEMLEKKECRFLFIMGSYDEMKLENISKNLYISNKLKENWSETCYLYHHK